MRIQALINKPYAIHCKTKREAERIAKLLHKLGATWATERSLLSATRWEDYKEEHCYNISNIHSIQFSEKRWYEEHTSLEIIDSKKVNMSFKI